MAELSDVLMMKALEDDNGHDTWGSAGFLWVILIFLRLSVMSSRAIARPRRRFLRTVMLTSFPSISWAPRCSLAAATSRRPSLSRIS